MALIVYTAIIASHRDTLLPIISPPDPRNRPIRFVCFTDMPNLSAPGWELLPPLWRHDFPRRTARWHKIMAHSAVGGQEGPENNAEYTLWLDATNQLHTNPWGLVDTYLSKGKDADGKDIGEKDLALFRHPQRTCVYDELEECVRLGYDNESTMRRQVDRYSEEGYPPHNGLFETAALLRRHTPQIQQFNERCWRELHYGSHRDQLCVNYVAWKMQLPVAFLPGCRVANPFSTFHPHKPQPVTARGMERGRS